jgi:hypothetical protein
MVTMVFYERALVSNYLLLRIKPGGGVCGALQIKGRLESNINGWFPFMYSQKLNCYFQNRIIMFCFPVPTLIYLREIYIFPWIGLPILLQGNMWTDPGLYKPLTDT